MLVQATADLAVTANPYTNESINTRIKTSWEYERDIAGRVDDDSLVLRNVFGHLCDMSLQNVVTVEVGHFSTALNPNLVL